MGGQSPCEQCYLLQTVMITLSTSPCALGSLRARQQTERSNSTFQLPTSPVFYCCHHSYGHVVQFRALQDSSSAQSWQHQKPIHRETLCLQHRWVTSWGSLGSLLLTHWGTDILRTQCPKVRVNALANKPARLHQAETKQCHSARSIQQGPLHQHCPQQLSRKTGEEGIPCLPSNKSRAVHQTPSTHLSFGHIFLAKKLPLKPSK